MTPPKPSQHATILHEALSITSEERHKSYGHPRQNHETTAAFWSAYLRRKYGADAPQLEGRDVCLMMILLKISRDSHFTTRDNLVDIAGYARNAEMIEEEAQQAEFDFGDALGLNAR